MATQPPPQPPPVASAPPLKPISAIDAISPAMTRAQNLVFKPFRWNRWWRLGLIGLAAGETLSSGGCSFPSNLSDIIKNHPQKHFGGPGFLHELFHGLFAGRFHGHLHNFLAAYAINLGSVTPWSPLFGHLAGATAGLIALLVVLVFSLVFIHLYISSVAHFMVFDAVVFERFRIFDSFKRWQRQGTQFFLFQLLLMVVSLAGWALLMGLPALIGWSLGLFHGDHVGIVVLAALVLVPLWIAWALACAIFLVGSKDFAVPILALENVSMEAALRRIWQGIGEAKSDYAIYFVMKILLAIGISIVTGILIFIVLIIPMIFFAMLVAVIAASGALASHTATTVALIFAGIIAFIVVLFGTLTLVGPPFAAFWQSYTLEFFASRYPALAGVLPPLTPAPAHFAAPPLPAASSSSVHHEATSPSTDSDAGPPGDR